ncbi:MAG TPA: 30S ribosomal protein S6 [Candidatus Polarisedimenticolia bacterium]|nr:30S ribosomal protein S6 [Candidatus Polarisedimenticolia bacterium]
MPQYESIFFTDPELPDEGLDDMVRGYEQLVASAEGKVLKVERWGKRRLAYPIGRHEEGHYVLMVIETPPSFVRELERRYRMNDRILRHLTVRVEHESQLGPSPMMKPKPSEREESPSGGEQPAAS